MIPGLAPRFLTWDEVDPAGRLFDAAAAGRVVRSLTPARTVPRRPDGGPLDEAMRDWCRNEAGPWTEALSYALAEHYGRWALGWRWSRGEGDHDGGPVENWCCVRDSVTTPEETLERVVAALREWRAWTEDLAWWFEQYRLDPGDPAAVEDRRLLWEAAARTLIRHVVDRTGCDSGWYGHCRLVLTWFLSHRGIAPGVAAELVQQAIGGRFHSWTSPDDVLVDEVAEDLARSLPTDPEPDPEPGSDPGPGRGSDSEPSRGPGPGAATADHLESWLALRETVPWHRVPPPGAGILAQPTGPARDGAAEDIRAFDGALDPARARGLLAALTAVRTDATRGAGLDFELIRSWQQHVLGSPQPPVFRTGPAFAKGGRERYGIGPHTRDRLDACLAESEPAAADGLPVTVRAARAYLDVCFFHPFDDGNARSAFLTLVYVLAREGVTLEDVGLLRRVSFQADSPDDPLTLARYVGISLAGSR